MNFIEMRDALNKHFDEKLRPQAHLFEVSVDKDAMWNTYLDAFPAGTNNIFRERREYDCSCCRDFIKHIGNVAAIINGKLVSIWDFEIDDPKYGPVVKAMSDFIHRHAVSDVYLSIESKVGCHHNFEIMESVGQHRWDHFFIELDAKHTVKNTDKGTVLGEYRTAKTTFKRALDEITLGAIDTVLELIADNSIYRGESWGDILRSFRNHKIAYTKLQTEDDKELYAWAHSVSNPGSLNGIRNTSMGTLLVDISENRDLEDAVTAYEKITAPENYQRPNPVYTEAMRKDAEKKVIELGFMNSLDRRFATLDDITVNDIMFADRSATTRIKGANTIFDDLAKDVVNKPKKFDRVETMSIDKFLKDVLPTAKSVAAYVENVHEPNFVSLIAPVNADAKSMFKWGNNFSWAYKGNATDSFKQLVKAFGGNIDAVLRFSIKWNEDGTDNVDLDAHCNTPSTEIYYRNKTDHRTGGVLDVDIIDPRRDVKGEDKTAVENITWADKSKMLPGTYRFFTNQYSGSASKGFRAEIECEGTIYSFDYPKPMRCGENVVVAEVTLDKNGNFTVESKLPANVSTKTIWGINTNAFVPVTGIMYSPNYWSTTDVNVGHRHVFFMLDGCVNDENPSGMFNEFLVNELREHKRVMAAIGNRLRVQNADDQLSGLGFATDKRASLIVKVTGASERILKITF